MCRGVRPCVNCHRQHNTHHALCVQVWDNPEAFMPERFPLDQPPPNEQNTDYR